eukprot:1508274-Rhodomonas_salina.8
MRDLGGSTAIASSSRRCEACDVRGVGDDIGCDAIFLHHRHRQLTLLQRADLGACVDQRRVRVNVRTHALLPHNVQDTKAICHGHASRTCFRSLGTRNERVVEGSQRVACPGRCKTLLQRFDQLDHILNISTNRRIETANQ